MWSGPVKLRRATGGPTGGGQSTCTARTRTPCADEWVLGYSVAAEARNTGGLARRDRLRAQGLRHRPRRPAARRGGPAARGGKLDVIVFFATRRAELTRRFPAFARAIAPDGGLWVAWPKLTSGVAGDLRENVVREIGLDAGLVDNKVAAIDGIWSGLRFVVRRSDR